MGISTTPSCSNVFSWGFADTDTSIGNDTAYILDWVSYTNPIPLFPAANRTPVCNLTLKVLKNRTKKFVAS